MKSEPLIDVPEIELTADELRSTTWLKLSTYMTKRLESQRRMNDGDLDPSQTAKTRGRIAELQNLLAVAERKD